jgi:hypothetical protein
MTLRIELRDKNDTTDLFNVRPENIISFSPTREHTAVSSFTVMCAPVDADLSINDRINNLARIYYDDGNTEHLLFDGELLKTDVSLDGRTVQLRGEGIGTRLKRAANSVRYEDVRTWVAIKDYVDTYLPDAWEWEVFEPVPTTLKSEALLRDVPEGTEWDELFGDLFYEPYEVDATGGLKAQQTCYLEDGSDVDNTTGDAITIVHDDASAPAGASQSEVVALGGNGGTAEWLISWDYELDATEIDDGNDTIPFEFSLRDSWDAPSDWEGKVEYYVDGTLVGDFDTADGDDPANNTNLSSWSDVVDNPLDLLRQGEVSFKVDMTTSDGTSDVYFIDAVAPHDTRFTYNFATGVDGNDDLAGPELYPDSYDVLVERTGLGATLEKVDMVTSVEDSDFGENGAWLLRNNASENYTSYTSEDFTEDFDAAGVFGSQFDLSARLSRKVDSNFTGSPTQGNAPVVFEAYEPSVTTNDISVIEKKREYTGTHLDILQQMHEDAGLRFTIKHDDELDTYRAETYKKGDITRARSWKVVEKSVGRDIQDYWNSVTVYGRLRDEPRASVTEKADEEIDTSKYGEVKNAKVIPRVIDDESELRREAISFLLRGLDGDVFDVNISIPARNIDPGYAYPVVVRGRV